MNYIGSFLRIFSFLKRILVSYPSWVIFISGACLNLCPEPFGLWFLAPFFLSPLLFLLEKEKSSWGVVKKSFLFFFAYFSLGLYWTSAALFIDLKQFFWLLPLSALGIPSLLSMIMVPSLFVFWKVDVSPFGKVCFFALALVLLEIVRTYIIFFFPWLLFGYCLTSSPSLLQNASWIGVFGLSFLTVLFGAIPYLVSKTNTSNYTGFILSVLLMGNFLGGLFFLNQKEVTFAQSPLLRIVQPNIPQSLKWDPVYRRSILQKLIFLSSMDNPSLEETPKVIIWPEAALPFFFQETPAMKFQLAQIIPSNGCLITGLTRRLFKDNIPIRAYNSLMVLDSTGEPQDIYDKVRLVPFGEYIPFRSFVHQIPLQKITHGTLDFSPGPERRTIQVDPLPPFLPLICFEISFPSLRSAQQKVRPEWILTLSNDAWFGFTIGPYQHLHMAQVRAVEERLPIIRGTNTGISAVISPVGRIFASLPLGKEGILDTKCPNALPPGLYAFYGNWLLPLFFFLFIFAVSFSNSCIRRLVKKFSRD